MRELRLGAASSGPFRPRAEAQGPFADVARDAPSSPRRFLLAAVARFTRPPLGSSSWRTTRSRARYDVAPSPRPPARFRRRCPRLSASGAAPSGRHHQQPRCRPATSSGVGFSSRRSTWAFAAPGDRGERDRGAARAKSSRENALGDERWPIAATRGVPDGSAGPRQRAPGDEEDRVADSAAKSATPADPPEREPAIPRDRRAEPPCNPRTDEQHAANADDHRHGPDSAVAAAAAAAAASWVSVIMGPIAAIASGLVIRLGARSGTANIWGVVRSLIDAAARRRLVAIGHRRPIARQPPGTGIRRLGLRIAVGRRGARL